MIDESSFKQTFTDTPIKSPYVPIDELLYNIERSNYDSSEFMQLINGLVRMKIKSTSLDLERKHQDLRSLQEFIQFEESVLDTLSRGEKVMFTMDSKEINPYFLGKNNG